MIASHTVPLIVVVFGRPGAGKTTVSEEAVRLLNTKTCSVETAATANYLHLDLDVCVPQWMRVSISRLYYVNILMAWHQLTMGLFSFHLGQFCKRDLSDNSTESDVYH